MDKLRSISDVAFDLKLFNKKTKKPSNYILRYWEKEFKQIKPIILNKRRYYSSEQFDLIKLINYLLKVKGLTIKGVKNILKSNINSLDDYNSFSLKADYHKEDIKLRTKKILKKLKDLKTYGKKNTY